MWSASRLSLCTSEEAEARCFPGSAPLPVIKLLNSWAVPSQAMHCSLFPRVIKTVLHVLTKWRGRFVWNDKCVKTNILRFRVTVCALGTLPLFAYNRSCCPDGGSAVRFVSVCRVAELTGKNLTPKPLIHKQSSNLHLQFRIHKF
jgi:hypothetical protein